MRRHAWLFALATTLALASARCDPPDDPRLATAAPQPASTLPKDNASTASDLCDVVRRLEAQGWHADEIRRYYGTVGEYSPSYGDLAVILARRWTEDRGNWTMKALFWIASEERGDGGEESWQPLGEFEEYRIESSERFPPRDRTGDKVPEFAFECDGGGTAWENRYLAVFEVAPTGLSRLDPSLPGVHVGSIQDLDADGVDEIVAWDVRFEWIDSFFHYEGLAVERVFSWCPGLCAYAETEHVAFPQYRQRRQRLLEVARAWQPGSPDALRRLHVAYEHWLLSALLNDEESGHAFFLQTVTPEGTGMSSEQVEMFEQEGRDRIEEEGRCGWYDGLRAGEDSLEPNPPAARWGSVSARPIPTRGRWFELAREAVRALPTGTVVRARYPFSWRKRGEDGLPRDFPVGWECDGDILPRRHGAERFIWLNGLDLGGEYGYSAALLYDDRGRLIGYVPLPDDVYRVLPVDLTGDARVDWVLEIANCRYGMYISTYLTILRGADGLPKALPMKGPAGDRLVVDRPGLSDEPYAVKVSGWGCSTWAGEWGLDSEIGLDRFHRSVLVRSRSWEAGGDETTGAWHENTTGLWKLVCSYDPAEDFIRIRRLASDSLPPR